MPAAGACTSSTYPEPNAAIANDPAYLQPAAAAPPCLLIPKAAPTPRARAAAWPSPTCSAWPHTAHHILLPVGNGTTLAGLVAGRGDYDITRCRGARGAADPSSGRPGAGIPARRIHALAYSPRRSLRWLRPVDAGLRAFMLAFEAVHGIALEPVYTGKMLYAIYRRLRSGEWRSDIAAAGDSHRWVAGAAGVRVAGRVSYIFAITLSGNHFITCATSVQGHGGT